tara:strand:- start:68 stop:1423 length:1356 start_codon:yes stop_codon:yes gene_type:complete
MAEIVEDEQCIFQDHCIIVARYDENLDWLNSLIETEPWISNVIIFNKGLDNIRLSSINKTKNIVKIKNVPNIGREGGTYLNYIITNYERLPDKLWFIQGNPFDHSPDFLNMMTYNVAKLYINNEFQTLTWRYNSSIPPNIESDKRFYIDKNRIIQYYINTNSQQTVEAHEFYDFSHDCKVKALNIKTPKPYGSYLHYMCGSNGFPLPSNIIPYCWSSIFYVKKSSILRNSRLSYKRLYKSLLCTNDQGGNEGFVLERLWQYILTHKTYGNIKLLRKELGWKYNDLCAMWNSSLMYIAIYDKSYMNHPSIKDGNEEYDSTMIYFNNETENFECSKCIGYNNKPLSILPCINLESAKNILKMQIDFSSKKKQIIKTFTNLLSNNIIPTFFWPLQNKKKVRIFDRGAPFFNDTKVANKSFHEPCDKKELAMDIIGGNSMKSSSKSPSTNNSSKN